MFVKCANGSCPCAFYYSIGAMVFAVKGCSGQHLEPGEAPVVYHWLCTGCLPILLTAWFDHGAGRTDAEQRVRLISLESVWKGSLTPVTGPLQVRTLQASQDGI